MGLQPVQSGFRRLKRLESGHIWKDPCQLDVDLMLGITMGQNMDEHRWEFEASRLTPGVDEKRKNWQPMRKATSDALEKRWIKGWEGGNWRDDFSIDLKGSIYIHLWY